MRIGIGTLLLITVTHISFGNVERRVHPPIRNIRTNTEQTSHRLVLEMHKPHSDAHTHYFSLLPKFIIDNMLSDEDVNQFVDTFNTKVLEENHRIRYNMQLQPTNYKSSIEVKASAYTNHPSETWGDPNITATGTRVMEGRTLAVSRDLFRLYGAHTKVHLFNLNTNEYLGEYIIEDKMSARFSNKIDIFMFSRKQALQFGVRRVRMCIVAEDE